MAWLTVNFSFSSFTCSTIQLDENVRHDSLTLATFHSNFWLLTCFCWVEL